MPHAIRQKDFKSLEDKLLDELKEWISENDASTAPFISEEFVDQHGIPESYYTIIQHDEGKSINDYSIANGISLTQAKDIRRMQLSICRECLAKPYVDMHLRILIAFNEHIDSLLNSEISYDSALSIYKTYCRDYGYMLSRFARKVSNDPELYKRFLNNEFNVITSSQKLSKRSSMTSMYSRYRIELNKLVQMVSHPNFDKFVAILILTPQFHCSIFSKLKDFDSYFEVHIVPSVLSNMISDSFPNRKIEFTYSKRQAAKSGAAWTSSLNATLSFILSRVSLYLPDSDAFMLPRIGEDNQDIALLSNVQLIEHDVLQKRRDTTDNVVRSLTEPQQASETRIEISNTPILDKNIVFASPIQDLDFDEMRFNEQRPDSKGTWKGTGRRRTWVSDSSSDHIDQRDLGLGITSDVKETTPTPSDSIEQLLFERTAEIVMKYEEDGEVFLPATFEERFGIPLVENHSIHSSEVIDSDLVIKLSDCTRSPRFLVTRTQDGDNPVFVRVVSHRWNRLSL